MTQKFSNAARSPLMANISDVATSLTVDVALCDLFPVADTGTDPVPTVGKDFLKELIFSQQLCDINATNVAATFHFAVCSGVRA